MPLSLQYPSKYINVTIHIIDPVCRLCVLLLGSQLNGQYQLGQQSGYHIDLKREWLRHMINVHSGVVNMLLLLQIYPRSAVKIIIHFHLEQI